MTKQTEERQVIIQNGRSGDVDVIPYEAKNDLSPMFAEIQETLANATEGMTQQMGQAVKVVEHRGGEGALNKTLVIRRDEIVLQWDFKFSTD